VDQAESLLLSLAITLRLALLPVSTLSSTALLPALLDLHLPTTLRLELTHLPALLDLHLPTTLRLELTHLPALLDLHLPTTLRLELRSVCRLPTEPRLAHPTEPRLAHPTEPRLAHPTEPRLAHPTEPRLAAAREAQLAPRPDPPQDPLPLHRLASGTRLLRDLRSTHRTLPPDRATLGALLPRGTRRTAEASTATLPRTTGQPLLLPAPADLARAHRTPRCTAHSGRLSLHSTPSTRL